MKIFDGLQSFFDSLGEYTKSFSNLFLIFVGAFLAVSVVVIIITSFAYECKLTKTVDRINKFLERNPRINDDNLVAFNNMMKESSVPKTLRRQWQQFMLYREHPASYYMSFQHCVENPMRNSTYRQQMTVYKVISYVLAILSLVVSIFINEDANYINRFLKNIVIIPITIIVLYWVISMVLDLVHSAISGDLFQNYQYFEINMDKAMLTLPEFVDYEVLFSQDEIKRGIPVLFAYLQKRAIQEQQELEKARLKSVDHEKFDFDKAGLDGSLVLDRAMRETENYTTQRKKYMQEIERVNNEIMVLENNYREQTKEFQRQVQTSKETVENLKEQLEQASSTIEINYIKKQMRDEINRQQEGEKEFDILTDKHNQTVKSLNQEIKHYEDEIKNAKEAMEVAMLSEFNTYSVKVYDNLEKIVDERKEDSINDYKDQIKNLEIELEEKNEELENVYTRYQEVLSQVPMEDPDEDPDEGIVLGKKDKKNKKSKQSQEYVQDEVAQYDENSQNYEEYYDEQPSDYQQDYLADSNDNYEQNYDYVQDEYIPTDDQYVQDDYNIDNQNTEEYNEYNDGYVPLDEQSNEYAPEQQYVSTDEDFNEYVPQNEEYVTQDDEQFEYVPLNSEQDEYNSYDNYIPINDQGEYVPQDNEQFEYIPQNEEYVPLDEQLNEYAPEQQYVSADEDFGEYIPQLNEEEPVYEMGQSENQEIAKDYNDLLEKDSDDIKFDDTDFDVDFNKSKDSTENFDDMDFDFEFDQDLNKAKTEEESPVESKEVDIPTFNQEYEGDFDLNKVLGLYDFADNEKVEKNINDNTSVQEIEDKPKRKAGRPRKVVDETEETPKRKVGRPRKEKPTDEAQAPKRKAGRPRKVVDETEETPKRRVGRPRKEKPTNEVQAPKRKAGRPRKVVDETEETPKRRVGRPRKEKSADENKAPKRKAGRPKKSSNETASKNVAKRGRPSKQEDKKVSTNKTTKGRGRPKKVESKSNEIVNEQGVLTKPKRKAGRPKKINK